MKTFDEKEMVELLKNKKVSMDEFVKTRDREVKIEEKLLEVETQMSKTLMEILNKLSDGQPEPYSDWKVQQMKVLNEIAGTLKDIRTDKAFTKEPIDYRVTFERDKLGLVNGKFDLKPIKTWQ